MRATITLLWPRECFVCGEKSGHLPVCGACLPGLHRLSDCACPRCALPVPAPGIVCGQCQKRPPELDATLAAFVYAAPVRDMLLALKHSPGFVLLDWLGQELSATLAGTDADCIVPVPLHRSRLTERGFNQSSELALRVGQRCGLKVWREAVVRDVATPKFSGMRGKARRKVVRGVFRCVEDFSGQHVVVLDDVMTSGATLNELARTIKQRGARRVTALVVARTLRQTAR